MKNERGITMIALIIVIILMLILTTTGVYTGIDAYKTMKTQTFIAQMKVLKEKVNIIREEYKNWDNYNGNNINEYIVERYNPTSLSSYPEENETKKAFTEILREKTKLGGADLVLGNYFYFTKGELADLLGVTNLDLDVIINFNTGTFVDKKGVEATTFLGATQHFYVLEELVASQNAYYNSAGAGNFSGGDSPNLEIDEISIKQFDEANNRTLIEIKTNSLKPFVNISMYNLNDELLIDKVQFKRLNNIVEAEIDITYIGFFRFTITDETTTVYSPVIEIVRVNEPIIINNGVTKVSWEDGIEYEPIEDSKWYNYATGRRKWANVKLADGSYYVWIPRFAYKIDNIGNIDIKFLKGKTNIAFDGTTVSSTYDTDDYIVHPAFRMGIKDVDLGIDERYGNGEFIKELSGIWVAKYEGYVEEIEDADLNYVIRSYPEKDLEDNPGITFNSIAIQAREIERYLDLYDFVMTYDSGRGTYDDGLNMTTDVLVNVDSHLIKNSEWGALAYLALSEFGVGTDYKRNTDLMTGEPMGNILEDEYAKSSTTGNIHGVFDMVNGNTEFVSGATVEVYTKYTRPKPTDSSSTGNSNIISNAYLTLFDSKYENNQKIGDGIFEFRNFVSFNQDKSQYLSLEKGVLTRGGKGFLAYKAVSDTETTEGGKIGIRITLIME